MHDVMYVSDPNWAPSRAARAVARWCAHVQRETWVLGSWISLDMTRVESVEWWWWCCQCCRTIGACRG